MSWNTVPLISGTAPAPSPPDAGVMTPTSRRLTRVAAASELPGAATTLSLDDGALSRAATISSVAISELEPRVDWPLGTVTVAGGVLGFEAGRVKTASRVLVAPGVFPVSV